MGVIERVEELGPELNGLVFEDPGGFRERHVPVELAGAEDDADAGITESGGQRIWGPPGREGAAAANGAGGGSQKEEVLI
jgi:hypothetical protein